MFRNYRLLFRLILSYLITGVLLTAGLLLFVSGFVSDQIIKQSDTSKSELLQQTYKTAYYTLTDIYGDFYALWAKDPDIQNALHNSSISAAQTSTVEKILDANVFRNNLVHSVYLLNETADYVISNLSEKSNWQTFFDKNAISLFHDFEKNYQSAKNEIFFPRQATLNLSGNSESRHYISLIFASMAADNRLHAGMIVNIDQARLSNLISEGTSNGQTMIINHSGNIISNSIGMDFASEFPEKSLFQAILTDTAEAGNRSADYLGDTSFITYRKADKLGFVFINIISAKQLMAPVQKTNRIIILLFAIAILISISISLFATRKIYMPLNNLIKAMQKNPAASGQSGLDEYTYLGSVYSTLLNENQQAQLLHLIQGQFSAKTLEILEFSRAKFLAVAIILDSTEPVSQSVLERLAQVVHQTLRLPATTFENQAIGLVFNADQFDETEMDWIFTQIAVLQGAVQEAMQITVSAGIGSAASNAADIKSSLQKALIAARHAASLGTSQMVPFSEIEQNHQQPQKSRALIADAIDQYIQTNCFNPGFMLEEIAEHIDLSVGYMRQIFKLERGIPINEYIISCRLAKACELLAESDLTAKDISEKVGYLDSRYFYTLFKKKIGMTTDEYRRKTREEKN